MILKLIINIVLLCAQNQSQLTKKQCLKIHNEAIREVGSERGVKFITKRVFYKRSYWNLDVKNPRPTILSLQDFFQQRGYVKKVLRFSILSTTGPSYLGSGYFIGDSAAQVCNFGLGVITANSDQFRSYFNSIKARYKHELEHALGGIHKENLPFDPIILDEQIKACIKKGLQ